MDDATLSNIRLVVKEAEHTPRTANLDTTRMLVTLLEHIDTIDMVFGDLAYDAAQLRTATQLLGSGSENEDKIKSLIDRTSYLESPHGKHPSEELVAKIHGADAKTSEGGNEDTDAS